MGVRFPPPQLWSHGVRGYAFGLSLRRRGFESRWDRNKLKYYNIMLYLIMGIITAIIIITLQLAYNKKKRYREFEGIELVMIPILGGFMWPITFFCCILFMLYKFFLKDIHEKIITWISERM